MIYEYAIEPEIVVEWAKSRLSCRYIIDNFGLGKPRLMSDYPKLKNWRKQFRQAASSLDDIAMARLEELFLRLTEKKIHRDDFQYDGIKSWRANSEGEHKRQPFRAILAKENPNNNGQVLINAHIGDWPEELWEAKQGMTVSRKAEAMASALSSMLRNSQEIVFIDPYFRANKKECRDPLKAFLHECVKKTPSSKSIILKLQASADIDKAPSANIFKEECEKNLPDLIPSGFSITITRWKQRDKGERLHNRYILTDLGGVIFPFGLSEGDEGVTDDIVLMDRDSYAARWHQYTGDNPAFDKDCSFTI